MTKENFVRYAELKTQVAAAEAEMDLLKAKLLDDLASVEDKPVELESVGVFSITKRKNWKYTEIYDGLKVQLKEREKEEQAKGLATFTEDRNVMFRPVKIETNE
ncbi:MAG: hypothetical protein WCV68_04570 [Candidatus Paceibacterota bacterium]|jgi:hypothetical protein